MGSVLTLPLVAHAAHRHILTTAHYRIDSDLDPSLNEDCARRMDAMFDEYARRFGPIIDLSRIGVFRVFLFSHRADYLQWVGREYQNTGGLFVPGRSFLAAVLEGQGRDSLRRTLQHEAFHQFVHEAMPNDLPVWLNEGMAQMFEEGLWTGADFWLGQVPPRRIRQLQADLAAGRIIPLRALASLTLGQWSQTLTGDRAAASARYDEAWAGVYFLTHYKDADGVEIYRPRLSKLLQLLHDRVDEARALSEVFPDFEQIDARFHEFAQRLSPTPQATLIERQNVLADLLAGLHARHEPVDDISHVHKELKHGAYRIRYSAGDVHWESEADVGVYFSDLSGRAFTRSELKLEKRPDAPLPDVVCRCFENYALRTRFHQEGERVEHEILIEPTPEPRLTTKPK